MMKDALKNRMKKLVIEVSQGEDGELKVTTPGSAGPDGPLSEVKDEETEMQESSDLAPRVKDSEEPGVIKENEQEDETQLVDEMLQRMPRPAPMDQNSLNARAQRGMQGKLDAKKGLKV